MCYASLSMDSLVDRWDLEMMSDDGAFEGEEDEDDERAEDPMPRWALLATTEGQHAYPMWIRMAFRIWMTLYLMWTERGGDPDEFVQGDGDDDVVSDDDEGGESGVDDE